MVPNPSFQDTIPNTHRPNHCVFSSRNFGGRSFFRNGRHAMPARQVQEAWGLRPGRGVDHRMNLFLLAKKNRARCFAMFFLLISIGTLWFD